MATLEELTRSVVVEVAKPDDPVTIVDIEWIGENYHV